MDYGMDQAAAAKDQEAGTHQEYPAALHMVTGYLEAAGPERPDCNEQAYSPNENLLANMVIEQEFSG
jgi:hypothetical protein